MRARPISAMYLLLLVFGAMLCVAGVLLAASGISVHDRTLDASLVTPGVVGLVGGCLLLGLGFALRVLQQIERALAVRPLSRAPRPGEIAQLPAPESSGEAARVPPPLNITRPPRMASVATPAAAATEKHTEELPEKFPSVVRSAATQCSIEPSHEVEESTTPPLFARKGRNGAAPFGPRLDMKPRLSGAAERQKGPAFDALWPRAPRPGRPAAQAAEPPRPEPAAPQPQRTPIEDPASEAASVMAPEEVATPLSILKSGVVDGMAYTLYSDGSIEAQLPQGTLRFGSIAELRVHIEQDSQH